MSGKPAVVCSSWYGFIPIATWWLRLKRLPTMQETRVRSLGREDPLEKEMATHSSTLAWGIPWTEEYGGPQSMGSQRVGHNCVIKCNTAQHMNGKGQSAQHVNGNG